MDNLELELMRQTILDHYENPRYKINDLKKIKLLKQYNFGHSDSPSCIDNIDAYVKIKNNKITDAKFAGIGCAICTSSTDIVSQEINNKSVKQAKEIIDNYFNMILTKKYCAKTIKNLLIFKNVNKQANRIKCALTGVQAIKNAIDKYEQNKK